MNRIEKLIACPREADCAWLITSYPNRVYLTDFSPSAGMVAVMGGEAYFLVDSRYIEAARSQIQSCTVLLDDPEQENLRSLLRAHGIRTVLIESYTTSIQQVRTLAQKLVPVEVCSDDTVSETLTAMRRIKSPEEIAYLREAQKISDAALAEACKLIRPGVSELDVMMAIGTERTRLGCEARSFNMIFTSGADTSLPHGTSRIRTIQNGDFVMIDMGSTIHGYASDMTRTLAVGSVSREQREAYNLVLRAQKRALEMIRPGVRCKDVDRAAREVILNSPYAEGCFGHGLGHSLGLEIHESPRFNPTDETILQPGMVITVEPGLYLPGRFGVRIEDMVVVTEDGCENLTGSPKELTILK